MTEARAHWQRRPLCGRWARGKPTPQQAERSVRANFRIDRGVLLVSLGTLWLMAAGAIVWPDTSSRSPWSGAVAATGVEASASPAEGTIPHRAGPSCQTAPAEAVPWRRTNDGWEVAWWLVLPAPRRAPAIPPLLPASLSLTCAYVLAAQQQGGLPRYLRDAII